MALELSNQPVSPFYTIDKINQSINLYQGRMRLVKQAENTQISINGTGEIKIKWFPQPRLKYTFKCEDYIHNDIFQHGLELSDLGIYAEAIVGAHSSGQHSLFEGSLKKPVTLRTDNEISYLKFHLANFHDFIGENIQNSSFLWRGRIVLKADSWNVTIDSLEPDLRKKLIKDLKNEGGYALMHTARLQRQNSESFSPELGLNILEGLSYFLSFTRGLWTSPMLLVGFDSTDHPIWQQWNFYRMTPYKEVMSWFPRQKTKTLNEAFSGFMRLWNDPALQESLKIIIHWYIESNLQAGAIEGSIILTQAAFELFFDLLVRKDSRKLKGDEKLRQLFNCASLPIEFANIPSDSVSLEGLTDFAKNENKDIPKVLSEVRNRITHPERKRDNDSIVHPIRVRQETWRLSLWYLELLILYWFDYEDLYTNRMKFNWAGDYDKLPWAGE
ncbi:MAG: hypothetical protein WBG32_10165 [Nodosilinea sp.]